MLMIPDWRNLTVTFLQRAGGWAFGPSLRPLAHPLGLPPNNRTVYGWFRFTPRKIPWKCHVDISMGSVSRKGAQEGVYLKDIEDSWPETWMTGSFLMSWWCPFTLRNISWKFQVNIFIWCRVMRDLGLNGQLPRERRDERQEREGAEVNSYLAM